MNNESDERGTSELIANEEILKDEEPGVSPPEPHISEIESTSRPVPPRNDWIEWVRQGLRASTLRPLHTLPLSPSAWQMLLIVGISLVISTSLSRFEIVGAAEFSLRSWLFGWASTGLMTFGVWMAVNFRSQTALHPSPVAAWFLLSAVATLPVTLFGAAISAAAAREQMPQWWFAGEWYAWAIYVGFWAWVGGITWRITKAINRSTWIAAGTTLWALVILGLNSSMLSIRSWEPVYVHDPNNDATLSLSQEVFETQQALLNDVLRNIEPRRGRQRQIYGLIFAPYSQDVFLRESAMVQEVLEQRFGAQDHIVRLVNHPTTADEIPWATNRNLERGLEALAKAMDAERDVLVLYLTSHGGADFVLATHHWPLNVESITANQLRNTLDRVGIRNRVIAVSACYSGGWIEPLQNDNTLIMTAADKVHTSFGCGSKSTLTFFGRAVFDEQLRKTASFEEAFKAAVPIISAREIEAKKSDGFSNPQISVGKDIRMVLREVETR